MPTECCQHCGGLPLACGRQVRVSLGYRVRVSRVMVRVVIETAKVAGTLVKSRGGTGRTASDVVKANVRQEGLPRFYSRLTLLRYLVFENKS